MSGSGTSKLKAVPGRIQSSRHRFRRPLAGVWTTGHGLPQKRGGAENCREMDLPRAPFWRIVLCQAGFTGPLRHQRIGQQPWWVVGSPSELDTATSFIPRLMHERLPEMGIDFAILYPSASQLFAPYLTDDELRIAGCRAFNRYAAETWAAYADRATPIGVIPVRTLHEAVAEYHIASHSESKRWPWAVSFVVQFLRQRNKA